MRSSKSIIAYLSNLGVYNAIQEAEKDLLYPSFPFRPLCLEQYIASAGKSRELSLIPLNTAVYNTPNKAFAYEAEKMLAYITRFTKVRLECRYYAMALFCGLPHVICLVASQLCYRNDRPIERLWGK